MNRYPIPDTRYPRLLPASRSGQSIIEAIVAIAVFTTGFLGIASLLARTLFLNRVVADQVTATYLASEGIELAKNLIDHDTFEAFAGDTNFGWGNCFAQPNNDVELDYKTIASDPNDCGQLPTFVGNGDKLLFDPMSHLYYYSFDTPLGSSPITTDFTREIRVGENGDIITVDSIVRWSTATVTNQSLVLEDVFYDWRK